MSISVKGFDGNVFDQNSIDSHQRTFETLHQLVFSGSYPVNGDILDMTNGAINSAVPPSSILLMLEIFTCGPSTGYGATDGRFTLVNPGSTMPSTNFTGWKVRIWAAGGGELSNSTYPSTITGDVIMVRARWRKSPVKTCLTTTSKSRTFRLDCLAEDASRCPPPTFPKAHHPGYRTANSSRGRATASWNASATFWISRKRQLH